MLAAKRPDETQYCLRVPIDSSMVDDNNRILPDILLKLIDIAGCVPVKRHLGPDLDPVTASIDRMNFMGPVRAWEVVLLDSRITRIWNTSIESRVVVTTWNFRTEEVRPIATAYMVTVATRDLATTKASREDILPLLEISPEDHLLKRSSDIRKEYRQFEKSRASLIPVIVEEDTPVVVETLMTRKDSNGLCDNVFGGVILSQVYVTGQKAVAHHLGDQPYVFVRQDRMDFMQPAKLKETLKTMAVVTRTFQTSIEVQAECFAVSPTTGMERLVASTYLIFVAVDDANRPAIAKPWTPSTPRQLERFKGAEVRRRLREDEANTFGGNI